MRNITCAWLGALPCGAAKRRRSHSPGGAESRPSRARDRPGSRLRAGHCCGESADLAPSWTSSARRSQKSGGGSPAHEPQGGRCFASSITFCFASPTSMRRSPSIAISLGIACCRRSEEAVGFALPDTDAELVVHLRIGPETDVLVEDVDDAFTFFLNAGGEAVRAAFRYRDWPMRARSRSLRQRPGHPGSVQGRSGDGRGGPGDRRPAFGLVSAAPGMIEIPSCALTNVLQMFS